SPRSLQLIQIRLGYYQLSRPLDRLLVLYIELSHSHRFRGIDLILGQQLGWAQFKDVQPAGDLRSVDVTVVPVGRPVATQYQHMWIDRPTIEIGNFNRMVRVGKVHNRDATLVPGLDFYVAAGNWNERAVVCHTILCVALCCWHL